MEVQTQGFDQKLTTDVVCALKSFVVLKLPRIGQSRPATCADVIGQYRAMLLGSAGNLGVIGNVLSVSYRND
jgi:hypothetical protein